MVQSPLAPLCCTFNPLSRGDAGSTGGSVHERSAVVRVTFDTDKSVTGFGSVALSMTSASESAFPLFVTSRMRM